MNNRNLFFQNVDKLLQNEEFIKWRLFKTKELNKYWTNFRDQNPHLNKELNEAILQFEEVKINHYTISELEKKHIYKNINKKIKVYKRRMWFVRSGYAAAVLLIGLASFLFIKQMKQDVEIHTSDTIDKIIGQALPNEDIYIISEGEKITLSDKSQIGLKKDGKAVITDSLHSQKELLLAKTELNKLVVPYGKRTKITLSDGTEVWLNSGTQLDFPTKFEGDVREIFVNGEIYIDVAHNEKTPFIVRTDGMDVLVYGTAFNISAYNDDISKTVVLVEGKVKIETDDNYQTELIPNEKIEIIDKTITKEIVDINEYVGWKNGMLIFNSSPMSDILKKIGRYYNVEFEKTQEVSLNDKSFSGKLFLSNNLDSVMTSISILSSTEYLRENKKIFISKK